MIAPGPSRLFALEGQPQLVEVNNENYTGIFAQHDLKVRYEASYVLQILEGIPKA